MPSLTKTGHSGGGTAAGQCGFPTHDADFLVIDLDAVDELPRVALAQARILGMEPLARGGGKAGEIVLVSCLLRHFDLARTNDEDGEVRQKARDWLPEAMQFLAIDPDAPENAVHDESGMDEPDEDMPESEDDAVEEGTSAQIDPGRSVA